MNPYINDFGIVCCLGSNKQEIKDKLIAGDRSGLRLSDEFIADQAIVVGQIIDLMPEIPDYLKVYACRNNQLLLAALSQIELLVKNLISQFGADRIGIVLGTSTSGVSRTEMALSYLASVGELPPDFHYKQQQMGAGSDFLAKYLNISGPSYTLSAACASSGKVFASAKRLLETNSCDAVIVGGADSLCRLTINGFSALESLSKTFCKPFGASRDGINIGEAASLFVLSRVPGPIRLAGIASTSDAYHYSAPDPEGSSVVQAMAKSLQQAGLKANQVDYLNLHGTGTILNDAMESRAVNTLFSNNVAVSSSKGMTGHTLGAAAALELGFCCLLLGGNESDKNVIPNINNDDIDKSLPALNWVKLGQRLNNTINVCQSNSFAFGGSNVSIVVTRV